MTLDDCERLLKTMAEYNVIELKFGDMAARRMPSAQEPPTAPMSGNEDFVKKLEAMPPDTQDRALMLRRVKGAV